MNIHRGQSSLDGVWLPHPSCGYQSLLFIKSSNAKDKERLVLFFTTAETLFARSKLRFCHVKYSPLQVDIFDNCKLSRESVVFYPSSHDL